jgi:hypothetical protein
MGYLLKFMQLSRERRHLVAACAGLLILTRVALRLLTYRRVHDLLERSCPRGRAAESPAPEEAAMRENVAWAVTVAASRIPGTTCLPRALVGQFLLRRAGCPARVRFGVAKHNDGAFAAHAWLESRDQILIGGETMLDYSPMPAWPPDVA